VTIHLHPGAAADLGSAGDWYEQQLPGLASDLTDEMDRALEAIAERPSTWPLWPGVDPALGVRRFLLPRFPFAIAYVVEGESMGLSGAELGHGSQSRTPGGVGAVVHGAGDSAHSR
jgi:hypothetical protein